MFSNSMEADLFTSDEPLDVEMKNYSPKHEKSPPLQPPRPEKPLPFYKKKITSPELLECIAEQCIGAFTPIQNPIRSTGRVTRRKFELSPRIHKPIPLKGVCNANGIYNINNKCICSYNIIRHSRQSLVNNVRNSQISSMDHEGMAYFRKTAAPEIKDLAQATNANSQMPFQGTETPDTAMDDLTERLRQWNLNNTDTN